jgi:hypothetical protein
LHFRHASRIESPFGLGDVAIEFCDPRVDFGEFVLDEAGHGERIAHARVDVCLLKPSVHSEIELDAGALITATRDVGSFFAKRAARRLRSLTAFGRGAEFRWAIRYDKPGHHGDDLTRSFGDGAKRRGFGERRDAGNGEFASVGRKRRRQSNRASNDSATRMHDDTMNATGQGEEGHEGG